MYLCSGPFKELLGACLLSRLLVSILDLLVTPLYSALITISLTSLCTNLSVYKPLLVWTFGPKISVPRDLNTLSPQTVPQLTMPPRGSLYISWLPDNSTLMGSSLRSWTLNLRDPFDPVMTPLSVSSCQEWLAAPPEMCSSCYIELWLKVAAQPGITFSSKCSYAHVHAQTHTRTHPATRLGLFD